MVVCTQPRYVFAGQRLNREVGGCGDRRPPAFYGGLFISSPFASLLCNGLAYSMALVLSASPINSLGRLGPATRTSSLTAARTAV